MKLGRVDEVDGDYIATRFVGIVPAGSVYVARNGSLRATLGGSNELRIRTQWQSVLLGYVRTFLPLAAIALPLGELALGGVNTVTWVASACLIALSLVGHVAGRLPEREKARLQLLGTVSGIKIDPSKLEPSTRERKLASLRVLMDKGGIPLRPDEILSVLDDIPLPALPLVYAYLRYAGDEPGWRECADIVLQRHELGEF
jgi:hypothetical protein